MSSIRSFFNHMENSSNTAIIAILPTKDPINIAIYPPHEYPAADTDPPRNNITKATPKLDPEVIPNMEGPANGFLNAVCNIRPDTVRAPPANIAVIAWGNRLPMIINLNGPSGSSPLNNISFIIDTGISTEPMYIFSKKRIADNRPTITNFKLVISFYDNMQEPYPYLKFPDA